MCIACVQEAMPFNQQQLCAMGVSHESIDNGQCSVLSLLLLIADSCADDAVVRVGSRLGLPTKLTGAGGGGCAISLVPPDLSVLKTAEFQRAMAELGYEVFECVIGQEGALYHFGESVPPMPRDALKSRL